MNDIDRYIRESEMEEWIRKRSGLRLMIAKDIPGAKELYTKACTEYARMVDEAWNAGYRTLNLNDHIIRLIPINQ